MMGRIVRTRLTQEETRPLRRIAAALDRHHELKPVDRAAIDALPLQIDSIAAGEVLVRGA